MVGFMGSKDPSLRARESLGYGAASVTPGSLADIQVRTQSLSRPFPPLLLVSSKPHPRRLTLADALVYSASLLSRFNEQLNQRPSFWQTEEKPASWGPALPPRNSG